MQNMQLPIMFSQAIVRKPCPEMIHGLTNAGLGTPDYLKALDQHQIYVEALRSCGLEVQVLEADSAYPDSVFVEDVALCTSNFAISTNPGASSRNGEKVEMRSVLKSYFREVDSIQGPGSLDAGDVMMVGEHFFIGISDRSNPEGADQLIALLKKHGRSGQKVPLKEMLHLKSGVSYLEHNTLLVSGEFIPHPAFRNFQRIEVDPRESYAANSLWINDRVLVPKGFPLTREKVRRAGYETLDVDVSEFQKLDGGLSCLSLRF
jgi:dimethylargininase